MNTSWMIRVGGVLEGHRPCLETVLVGKIFVKRYETTESSLVQIVILQLDGQVVSS